MMGMIGLAAVIGLFLWLIGFGRRKRFVAPEDDIDTPLEIDELELAERELAEDEGARPIHEAFEDDDDDWGPGSGGSVLPGII